MVVLTNCTCILNDLVFLFYHTFILKDLYFLIGCVLEDLMFILNCI